jgi:hypothetical protein
MTVRDTNQALAQVTDEGLFEHLATAVLRIAEPLCAGLSHPGVNADGKTRKSPLDGIGFVRGADPPHLVTVHHTTTAEDRLEAKWLHDPASAKPRAPSGKPTAPPGDLVKTAEIVAEERVRTPALQATLILTTNGEPDEKLVRAVRAAGAAHRIEVDVWPRSRLAHVLDTNPTGQWIRRTHLGIDQEMLSEELLGQLSRTSLDVFKPHDDPRAWVPRQLERVLRSVRRPISLVVAESGLGKSVACYRVLLEHVESGGYGLVLPHELIARASTLDQAVSEALRQLHPALALGQSPLPLCSHKHPLIVVVEDINRSGHPQRLLEKIAGWGLSFGRVQAEGLKPWRLFCPVWPSSLALVNDPMRKLLDPMLIVPEPMSAAEGREAVIARTAVIGRTVSEITAEDISAALGHDPLLIALHDIERAPDPRAVLGEFIERTLQRAQAPGDAVSAEFRVALMDLAGQMLHRRRLEPSWSELGSWRLTTESLRLLRSLTQREELLRLRGVSTDLRLIFRHARVRDWLLVEAASSMDGVDTLPDDIVSEPFFAEVIGATLVRRCAAVPLLERVQRLNPLALFHALRVCPQSSALERSRIVGAIENWLAVSSNLGPAYRHLRWEALVALEATDGSEIPGLVERFPERTMWGHLARLRNGDLGGGIEACLDSGPGVSNLFRDRHIEHAKMRFGAGLFARSDQLLRREDLDGAVRSGLLRLVGHFGEPGLAPAISASWSIDTERGERLSDYLWAFARCCEPSTASVYLDPVCAAWAELSDQAGQEHKLSPRDEVADPDVRWAFERAPPLGAIDYFVTLAQQPDLHWQIVDMLHLVDDPRAITFTIAELGAMRTRAAATSGFVPLSDMIRFHWKRAQEAGRPMSQASRYQLLHIWKDQTIDLQQRIAAFDIWAATQDTTDVEILLNASENSELADRILRQRLDRADASAIPALTEKLSDRENGYRWWLAARHVWSPELTRLLDSVLAWRRDNVERRWGVAIEEDSGIAEIIVRLPVEDAERVLMKHWDHLRFSTDFVQAALYVATPELCRQVAASVAEAPEPSSLFKYLPQQWGVRTHDHPGITRETQILALEPHLHLIAVSDLKVIADACNRRGWFALRERLLDARLAKPHYIRSAENASVVFDSLAAQNRHYWVGIEIDNAV